MPSVQKMARVLGQCFSCRDIGHLCFHCPVTAGGAATEQRRWYPVFDTTESGVCVCVCMCVCELAQILGMECINDVEHKRVSSVHFGRDGKNIVLSDEWQVDSDDVCVWEMENVKRQWFPLK